MEYTRDACVYRLEPITTEDAGHVDRFLGTITIIHLLIAGPDWNTMRCLSRQCLSLLRRTYDISNAHSDMDQNVDPRSSPHDGRFLDQRFSRRNIRPKCIGELSAATEIIPQLAAYANEHPTGRQANEEHLVSSAGSPHDNVRMCTQYAISATARSSAMQSGVGKEGIVTFMFSMESLHLSGNVCRSRC